MPGQTDNSTILAAENQEVVSLNEIVTAINGLKTSLVSSLSSLTIAIKGLQDMVTINNYCGSCGSGSTQTTTCPPCPTSPAAPGDDPSDNQTDPPGTTEEIAVRQCKVAVWLVDNFLRGIASWCDQYNIDYALNIAASEGTTLLTAVASGVAVNLIAAVLALFITPGPDPTDVLVITLGVVLSGVVAYMATNNLRIDFANLVSFIDDNRSTLICALYNSGDAWTAHSALMVAIDNTSPGLDAANRNFVDKLVGNNDIFLGLLFYVDDRFSLLESWLADQTTTCPCAETEPETGTPTDTYKCKAANYVFDGFVDSLTGWGTVSTMSWYSTPTFITALTNGLLSNLLGGIYTVVFAGVVLAAAFQTKVISYLGQLFWHGSTYFEAFTAVAAEFTANKEAIICELYLAEDVASAKAALEVHIADYVGSVMTAHPAWSEQEDTYTAVIEALLPTDVLNVLFESTPRDEITGSYDCSVCSPVLPVLMALFASGFASYESNAQYNQSVVSGTFTEGEDTTVLSSWHGWNSSDLSSSNHWIVVQNVSEYCISVEVSVSSEYDPRSDDTSLEYYNCVNSYITSPANVNAFPVTLEIKAGGIITIKGDWYHSGGRRFTAVFTPSRV